jgi:pimeloyl-ACP methyl ester carboxylesterase
MGGPVIIEAARRLPGRVVALIGVDNFQSFSQSFAPEEVDAWVARFRPDFAGATDRFVRAMFPEGADTALVNHVAADLASSPPEMAIEAISETIRYDFRSALAEVRLPIRTISSDKYPTDTAGNAAIAASFAVKLMPGRGHFLFLEDPVTFNRLLHETLSEFRP